VWQVAGPGILGSTCADSLPWSYVPNMERRNRLVLEVTLKGVRLVWRMGVVPRTTGKQADEALSLHARILEGKSSLGYDGGKRRLGISPFSQCRQAERRSGKAHKFVGARTADVWPYCSLV
jgi:hypothetical protein